MAKHRKQQEVISVEDHESIIGDLVFDQMVALLEHYLTEAKGLTFVQVMDFLATFARVTQDVFPADHPDKEGLSDVLFERCAADYIADYCSESYQQA